MNILFVLYGDFTTNSANLLVLYARELHLSGHSCVVAVPTNIETVNQHTNPSFIPLLYRDVLAQPESIFPDGRLADVIHAWTPREFVRKFVTSYMAIRPTPLLMYLEDNESWISCRALGYEKEILAQQTEQNITDKLPEALSHPFRYDSFIGLADTVAVIQDKLKVEVPPWVNCETVMPGVDLDFFSPRPPDLALRKQYGVAGNERVIVYHGGLNGFTKPGIQSLCTAVGLINQEGYPCRLLRAGPFAMDFLGQLPTETAPVITDLGLLPKHELPDLLALADIFVQPGKIDPFEDLRLPGKLPEFLAMGRPVIMPDVNISHLFRDGFDAVLLSTGSAEEIASKCIGLFSDLQEADRIGCSGRILAEKYFDVRSQACRLEDVYKIACNNFNPEIASAVWREQAKNNTVTSRLTRKLRLMAKLSSTKIGFGTGKILGEHARYIDLMQQRVKGLEVSIAERDGQIDNLHQTVADRENAMHLLKSSISWRITRPIRELKSFFKKQKGFQRCMKVASILKREGWREVSHLLMGGYRKDYPEWIRRYDTLTDNIRATMRNHIDSLHSHPLISVVMPTYNSNPEYLIEAIESVRKQIYPHWELCIADDASTDVNIRPILERFHKKDSRIKIVFRKENGHISEASNSALKLATGDYIALLDHDDLLSEHALFWVAKEINKHPDVKLIYSDEDKIDLNNLRHDPYFKCDWNLDLFLSHNLITHLGIYKAELIREINGFRVGFEGAQDYDLALRCIDRIRSSHICHIPRILYHWRVLPGSTAFDANEKPYAMLAGERAINDYLGRNKIQAKAKLLGYGYRVKYMIPDPAPLVSLIIPTRNGVEILCDCIDSILKKTTYKNYEIIIIDNGSDEDESIGYLKFIKTSPNIKVIRDEGPFNYSALNNEAIKYASGTILGLLNNDIEVITPEWLEEMVSHACRLDIGAVGARLIYPDETLQHAGVILGLGGLAAHSHRCFPRESSGYVGRARLIQSLSAVTGACLFVRKNLYEEVAGLNSTNLAVAYNDIDFCLRLMEKGYRNLWTPYAELYHHESKTRGSDHKTDVKQKRFENEKKYMRSRWRELLNNDPAYNPNLTLEREDFSLAFPPRVQHVL